MLVPNSILPPIVAVLVKNTKSPVDLPCAVADTVTVLLLTATLKAFVKDALADTGVTSNISSPLCS